MVFCLILSLDQNGLAPPEAVAAWQRIKNSDSVNPGSNPGPPSFLRGLEMSDNPVTDGKETLKHIGYRDRKAHRTLDARTLPTG